MIDGLVLASASPRRRELLARVGIFPRVLPSNVDEAVHAGEQPETYVVRVAEDKARMSLASAPVLAADTVVDFEGEVLGKPGSTSEAVQTLRRLSGRVHYVRTAVVLRLNDRFQSELVTTEVRFRALSSQEITDYVESREPFDKAGSYAIQGGGGALVAEIHGSYTNVVGLPLEETLRLLGLK